MVCYAQVDEKGRVKQLAAGFHAPPFDGALECPDAVLEAPDRWWFIGGEWKYMPLVQVVAEPAEVGVGEPVRVVALLPEGSPDSQVLFEAMGVAVSETVSAGVAEHYFAFELPGTYNIRVQTERHGSATVEVSVR